MLELNILIMILNVTNVQNVLKNIKDIRSIAIYWYTFLIAIKATVNE